jgi:beta-glucosidase
LSVDNLLAKMTLEEQVSLLAGEDFWTTVAIPRLKIPKIKVTDGPNGARGAGSLVGGVKSACFPCAISIGSSFDPALARAIGKALAEEAKSKSARVLLAPTVNLHRSGLNGRNFECYSEDPHLTSELAVGYIEGVQGEGIAATIKHFVGNESEIERFTISSDIGERALRELYLPPFEAAVKRAGVRAIMSSYNRLNGTFTSDHAWLLTQVLRVEWGYDGIVMSDWFGSHSTVESVAAGLDLEMPGPTRDRGEKLVAAVKSGALDAENVKDSARRILDLIRWTGAFAAPEMHEELAEDRPEHRALIRRAGAEGTVLLKNNGVLPLNKSESGTIAVLGPNSADARIMGGGSAQINAHYSVTPLEGIRKALAGSNAIFHVKGVANNRLVRLHRGPVHIDYFNSVDLSGAPVHAEDIDMSERFWMDPISKSFDIHAFSARVTFSFTPEADGDHVFGLVSAGRSRLNVAGKDVIDAWDNWKRGSNYFTAGNDEARNSVSLKAGVPVQIVAEFRSPFPGDGGINLNAIRIGVELPLGDAEFEEALKKAENCDVAIIFAGREGEWDTEGNDLPDMRLPGRQDELIARVAAVNENTVVVLQTGGPVEMPWLDDVAAVMQCWYPGQEAGNAIADVLFGFAEPGGRLPQTFPVKLADNSAITGDPLVYPGKDGHVAYREGVFVGYRHHDTRKIKTLFPFGYGLSYTSFAWGRPKISAETIGSDGLKVTLNVTNTGKRTGSDVVQLYVRPVAPKVERPEKELRAFRKIRLGAGEAKQVELCITLRDLCRFDETEGCFVADAGEYEAVIAASAEDIRHVCRFSLEHEWKISVRD